MHGKYSCPPIEGKLSVIIDFLRMLLTLMSFKSLEVIFREII